ncbi:hypothetical protein KA005_14470, partial [bacterium]|nr:hypothetical protein [bacterium]
MNSSLPKRFESFEVNLHVLPRFPLQTHIGQSLLEFALYTNSETLLEAASMVGNWLDSVGISVGTYRAWNVDPNFTATLMPGYILSTTRTGKFFLNLYTATGNSKFRVAALDAANFLADPDEGNFTLVTGTGITWGLHKNGIAEAAEVGEFLMEIKELGQGDFTEVVTGIEDYFLVIANYGADTINWFESPGLTQTMGQFFAMRENSYKMIAEQAKNWIVNKIDNNISWFNSLIPSIRPEDLYDYYTGTGLVGVGEFLIYLEDKVDSSNLNHVVQIVTRLLNIAYTTEKGINWYEPSWTTNVTKLVHSVNLDSGAAGVASFLINAY